jgi:PAS domain S-box-containing protein
MSNQTKLTSKLVSEYCVTSLLFLDNKGANEILGKLESVPNITECWLYDLNGSLFAYYSKSKAKESPVLLRPSLKDTSYFSGSYFFSSNVIVYDNVKYGFLVIKTDASEINHKILNFVFSSFLFLLPIVIISFFIAYFLQSIISKPILKLARQTDSISQNLDNTQKLKVKGKDEIGRLYASFNRMLEQLQERKVERDVAEIALRESEDRYRTLVEDSPVAIFVLDRDRIIYSNSAGLELFGAMKKESILHNSFLDYVHPDFKSTIVEKLANINHPESFDKLECKIVTLEGKIVFIEITSLTINFAGEDAEFLICLDITDKKKSEDKIQRWNLELEQMVNDRTDRLQDVLNKLRQEIEFRKTTEEKLIKAKDEAERANRVKSEFLSNMSHEIRTPMNAIIGFSEILLKQIPQPEYKEHIKTILSSGNILLSLIDDILDLSKIEAGRLELNYESVNLNKIFVEIQRIFNQKIEQKSLEFKVVLNEQLPKGMQFDELRLRQILFNLVGNAVKFTDSGSITVSTDYKQKSNGTASLSIHVQDTGIGISTKQQKLVFEAFYQQRGQSTRKYGGTGLGLAICKRLADMMNGQILLDSKVNVGSTFTLHFPEVEIIDDTLSIADEIFGVNDEVYLKFLPAKVLIIDDQTYNRELVKIYLNELNLKAIEAEGADEAFLKIGTFIPDLILMDIKMPEIDGFELSKMIKSNFIYKDVPIIAFTALAKAVEDDFKLFSGYLRKPVKRSDLIAELIKYLPLDDSDEETDIGIKEVNDNSIMSFDENSIRLQDELIKVFLPRWESFQEIIIIDNVEDFASDLLDLNREFKNLVLSNYVDRLKESCKSYNVVKIKKTLDEFTCIIEMINGKSPEM